MREAVAELIRLRQLRDETRRQIELTVPRARREGATWQELGDALLVHRQVVWRKYRKVCGE